MVRLARRQVADLATLRRFRFVRETDRAGADAAFPVALAEYAAPIMNPPAQRHLFENKLHNLRLACSRFDGLVIRPGWILSFYGILGDPTAARGYRDAAVLSGDRVIGAVGGSLCQLSGVLYNAALLAGMRIVERHPHSLDIYGEARYIPLGRDATITYGHKDLRFANPGPRPVLLHARVEEDRVVASLHGLPGSGKLPITIDTEMVSETPPPVLETPDPALAAGERIVDFAGYGGKVVRAHRVTREPGRPEVREHLSTDTYGVLPGRARVGRAEG